MNINETIKEIGILETNLKIEKYLNNKDLINSLDGEMPIPTKNETEKILNNATSKIVELNKKNIFILSNEIALIEKLSNIGDKLFTIIVGLSRNLTEEQIDNIKKNIPKNGNINFINELEYPNILKPKDSIIIALGYKGSNNCLVTKNTYRMLDLYKSFLGKKVFIKCTTDEIKTRYREWISINEKDYFDFII